MRTMAVAMAATLMLLLGGACSLGDRQPRQVTNADLRAMALVVRDLPPGFRGVEAKFINNEEMSGYFNEPDEVRGLLDRWGRVAGFQATFTTTADTDHLQHAVAV